MDPTSDVSNKIQDSTMAAKQRFESFKMGGGAPANSLTNHLPKHPHGRSRSRNSSISSLSTFSISASASAPSLPSPPFVHSSINVSPNGPPSKRPTSHHRRRSSVSTRCESADLMGVSLPDLPPAHSDDNINFGDRDSIRRRALLALEGKPDFAFSKVEIPDITSPDSTKSFEFPTKPSSFPASTGIGGHGINNLMSKRDSFGKLFGPTSTSKDQLHTLIEEEEEEEETQEERPCQAAEELREAPAIELVTPVSMAISKSPSRPRPATLNLKPLSLVSAVGCGAGNLPTPTLTPCPGPSGSSDDNATDSNTSTTSRHSITDSSSTSSSRRPSRSSSSRRPSVSSSSESPLPYDLSRKRSSISYKRSVVPVPRDMGALPSPDATPINRCFPELNNVGSVSEQPLTATEQHFLFKSHNVLLARIIDLERTLRSRSMSRSPSISTTSDTSANSSEPSDEILQLISDLKAERDELKRDVDGWRLRVADADKQSSALARRVEAERREAWVARSRLGLLEIEKNTLEKALGSKNTELEQSISQSEDVKKECDSMRDELHRLRARLRDADDAVDECIRLRAALEEERTRRAELEKLLDNAGLLNTPTISRSIDGQPQCSLPARSFSTHPRGLGFQSIQSIDSDSSSTDVESVDHSFTKTEFTLDAVTEEDEDEDEDPCDFFDEDNGLAGYEDEDDTDLSFQSPCGSSIGSGDEFDLKAVSLNEATTRLNSLSKPSNSVHASLSKTWTFPRGQTSTPLNHDDDEVDRFFGCFDDDDNSSPLGSEETRKALFKFGSVNDDDEEGLPPFVIPSDVGTVVPEPPKSLGVVLEEDEDGSEADDEDDGELLGEEVEGGIRFTFNPPTICVSPPAICISPPPAICVTPPIESEPALVHTRKSIPVYEPFDDEEDDSTFTFPQSRVQEPITSPSASPVTSESSSRPSSRTNSPSSIPRATSLRSFVPTTPTCSATPPSNVSGSVPITAPTSYPATSFSTPPSRRGGTTPSFIPQPVSPSPSKISTSTRSRVHVLRSKAATNVNEAAPRCYGTSEKVTVARSVPSDTCEYPERQALNLSFSSIMSSPLAARLSFQTLANFIPHSWSPGAAAVASRTTPHISIGSSDDAAEVASLFASAGPGGRHSAERRFVSRDQQLKKLRNRLGDDHNGIGHCPAVNTCSSCNGPNIFL